MAFSPNCVRCHLTGDADQTPGGARAAGERDARRHHDVLHHGKEDRIGRY